MKLMFAIQQRNIMANLLNQVHEEILSSDCFYFQRKFELISNQGQKV